MDVEVTGTEPATTAAPIGPELISPLLAVPGAVPDTGRDVGTAWHYGDPLREQRRLAAGAAVTDLSHRGVVRVAGPDRLSWLHSITTQHLTGLGPGTSTESLVLSPHGHIEHDLHLVDDGESTWVTVEPGTTSDLVAWLEKMRFMLRVEVRDETAAWAVVGTTGTPGGWADRAAGAPPVWSDPWPAVAPGSVSYAQVPDGEHPGLERGWHEIPVPRGELVERLAGLELAGSWAAEALRVAAWRPRLGAETDHRTIPHEVDWLRSAVHLAKGCYRGQETVARVHNLGRPPRRLVMLHLDGSEHTLPEAGEAVLAGTRPVGTLTTAVRHHELGPVALALVKRSVPADAALVVGGLAAAQEVVVKP